MFLEWLEPRFPCNQGRTQEFFQGDGNFEKNILFSLKYRLPYLL